MNVIRIVAAVVTDSDGKTLLVRKRGTAAFMQAGGKLLNGEPPLAALERELIEELGCGFDLSFATSLGVFTAPAANEADSRVEAQLFAVILTGEPVPQAEIEEAIWIDPAAPNGLTLAPLTAAHALPLARELAV